MSKQVSVLDEIDQFLSHKCEQVQQRFEELKPARSEAIQYNNQLAEHWQPGIKTRSQELEEAELKAFMNLIRSPWLKSRRHPRRPTGRALIIDLGGGNGKVVEWIAALSDELAYEVSYLYTDISPRMQEEAEARFIAMKSERPGRSLHGYFTLACVTQPIFSANDWTVLRRAFFPIIGVCAGGTIGNFGDLEAADDAAQDLVFTHYIRPADASLVTFLDPLRVETSLAAYASFGGRTGMYDGQVVNAYVLAGRKNRLYETWTVPFAKNGHKRSAAVSVVRAVSRMSRKPFWLKLDMIRNGEKVGQVTRHYSERYAKRRFLGDKSIFNIQPCGRAFITVFGESPARP